MVNPEIGEVYQRRRRHGSRTDELCKVVVAEVYDMLISEDPEYGTNRIRFLDLTGYEYNWYLSSFVLQFAKIE